MTLSQYLKTDKLINEFMGNGLGTEQEYYQSWNQLMKVTKEIFKRYEKKDTQKICQQLRYALYWNDFEHIYETTVFVIKQLKTE